MSADRFPEPVAIVGMSGCFSGARDLRQYWQNIVEGVPAMDDVLPILEQVTGTGNTA